MANISLSKWIKHPQEQTTFIFFNHGDQTKATASPKNSIVEANIELDVSLTDRLTLKERVLFPEDCWTLRRQDVRHHNNPTQLYRLSLITPIPRCHFLLPYTTSVSLLLHVHPQCRLFLTDGTLMSFLLCHWILITSLENKNKTLIAQLLTHSWKRYISQPIKRMTV